MVSPIIIHGLSMTGITEPFDAGDPLIGAVPVALGSCTPSRLT